jgi:L-threonylcarbamoyladenylate synthase
MTILPAISDHHLVELLDGGAVGVLPCDTIYGLVASARDPKAVARLYLLKDREQKPGTVIAASVEQLVELGLNKVLMRGVAHLWPNPLSIVIPAPVALDYLTQNVGSLAVRIPKHPALLELLERTGPLLTSSANHPGEAPANNLAEARKYFANRVDFYVDGGNLSGHAPSTVVRLGGDGSLTLLRAGAVTINEQGDIV